MPVDDAWDWPMLLYVGTVILKRPESHFWRMTPRKLNALTKVHVEINSPGESKANKPTTGYIDQIF